MRDFILILHIISSILAFATTLYIVIRAISGLAGKLSLSKKDIKLPLFATLLLYLQLILGTALFIFYMIKYSNGEIDLHQNRVIHGRFWAVEHFVLMVFTLVISHIGWVFARNNRTPRIIFKKNLLYFGIACSMIILSMVMNIVRYVF